MSHRLLRCLFVVSLLPASFSALDCAAAGVVDAHGDSDQPIQIPIADLDGQQWTMQGRICRPQGVANPRLVVVNHGSPPRAADRPSMALTSCDSEAAQWFLQRHYAVVFALRLGYGATGGPWTEGFGGCDAADYYRSGLETARQIKTIVDFVVTGPGIDPHGLIVVGHSAGGWGTLAYDSIAHPNVAAFINMAGGRGGHFHDQPNSNCRPELLVAAAARFGRTAGTPMLWIYAGNDSFFNPDLAKAMYQSFSHAGGQAELVTPDAFDGDGHRLFFGHDGSDIWGPAVEAYLQRMEPPAGR
jgi:pimeloyl-ACP methyl ester carboxylesterase